MWIFHEPQKKLWHWIDLCFQSVWNNWDLHSKIHKQIEINKDKCFPFESCSWTFQVIIQNEINTLPTIIRIAKKRENRLGASSIKNSKIERGKIWYIINAFCFCKKLDTIYPPKKFSVENVSRLGNDLGYIWVIVSEIIIS